MKFLPRRAFTWIISLLLSHWKWVLKFVLHFNFSPIDIYIFIVLNFVRMTKFWLKLYRYIFRVRWLLFCCLKYLFSAIPMLFRPSHKKVKKKPKLKFKMWIVVCVTIPFSFFRFPTLALSWNFRLLKHFALTFCHTNRNRFGLLGFFANLIWPTRPRQGLDGLFN